MSDHVDGDLASRLPPWLPNSKKSNNYRLLAPIESEIESAADDLRSVDNALNVQTAETIEQIERIAKLVDIPPRRDEELEHYRARVMAEFQLLTCEGTVRDVLESTATILGTDVSSLRYEEQPGSCQLGVPTAALDKIELSPTEFAAIVDRLVPSSYSVLALTRGSFTYITPEEYESSGFVHDPDRGYDGLDANGDPKGNGGTYAGVI